MKKTRGSIDYLKDKRKGGLHKWLSSTSSSKLLSKQVEDKTSGETKNGRKQRNPKRYKL